MGAMKTKQQTQAVLRYIAFVLLALVLCIAEKTWFSLNIGSSPFFAAAFCAALGYYTDTLHGMGFGVAVGLFSDAIGGNSIYILPLLYLFYGALGGVLGEHMYRKRLLSAVVPLFCVSAVHALYRAFVLLLGCGFQPQGMVGTFAALGIACLVNVMLGLPLFWLVKLLAKERAKRKVRRGKVSGKHKRI